MTFDPEEAQKMKSTLENIVTIFNYQILMKLSQTSFLSNVMTWKQPIFWGVYEDINKQISGLRLPVLFGQ